ncbi:MAG: tRNA epoxyqueuosine(34) reductase QueG, partial [Anaerolineaceae bacterium]
EQGCQAGMTYLARPDAVAARKDPHLLLPGCRSILCLAAPYPSPQASTPSDPEHPRGIISAYAALPDYHEELRSRLQLLTARLGKLTGHPFHSKACVDSLPMFEKYYAQCSGLGWIGRNTLLTAPAYGSWLFLAELLTELELEPTSPVPSNQCLECDRCVQACPTGALLPNRTIDARKCLSYLTIEHRGPIPEAYRPLLGLHVFGCDICQSACPYNHTALSAGFTGIFLPMVEQHPELFSEFALSEADFTRKYQGTPVLRARYQSYRRNVAIALGNSGSRAAIPFLQQALKDEPDPLIVGACHWALEQLGTTLTP